MPTLDPTTTSTGRPRDPKVDTRVADAAMRLFGDVGWTGFSVEAVARLADVGKASIYLRWRSKEDLLNDAVRARMAQITDIDTGTARGDLVRLAQQILDLHFGVSGRAAMRIALDGAQIAELREQH